MFDQMIADGIISIRGLKADAVKYGELIFDVNSAYFHNHGGYEYAKQFYTDAYKAAVEIVGGEQYILSAVMHADERNRAMSEALEMCIRDRMSLCAMRLLLLTEIFMCRRSTSKLRLAQWMK